MARLHGQSHELESVVWTIAAVSPWFKRLLIRFALIQLALSRSPEKALEQIVADALEINAKKEETVGGRPTKATAKDMRLKRNRPLKYTEAKANQPKPKPEPKPEAK